MSLPKVIDCFGPTDVQRRSIRLGRQQFWVNVAPVDPKLEYIPVFANHTCVFFGLIVPEPDSLFLYFGSRKGRVTVGILFCGQNDIDNVVAADADIIVCVSFEPPFILLDAQLLFVRDVDVVILEQMVFLDSGIADIDYT